MCGKFTFMATWAQVVAFSQPLTAKPTNAPEETATPMRWAPVLHLDAKGERTQTSMRWGFSKFNKAKGYESPDLIHARDDKVLRSEVWRPHFETRRGLLIVTSFNEGEEVATFKPDRVTPTGKTRTVQWTIRPKDGSMLAIAVLYRDHLSPVGPILEFVQVTTPANEGIGKFVVGDPDKRMPAVLPASALPMWLGEIPASPEAVRDLLRTYEDGGAWEMRRAGEPRAGELKKDKPANSTPKAAKTNRGPGLF